jgi:hypothetical protein
VNRNENLIVWRRTENVLFLAARCAHCEGVGSILTPTFDRTDCVPCEGRGWFGIVPQHGATADPGSVEKVAVLGVRYASGTPLWNGRDRCACETLEAEEFAPVERPRRTKKRRTAKGRKRTATRQKSQTNGHKHSSRRSTALAP